ncbi:MAG: SMI1/KNR4 family protein [Gammaproteobacteria bacterium]|nr:SMI1/KNR4 family protein [Gammaproteobacteria bacterium]
MKNIDLFIENWTGKNSMVPIAWDNITDLESNLAAYLPDSYKYLLSTYGLVRTPNVLTKTCDLNVEISNVQDFLSLEDVCSLSKLYEMTGMPTGHILFASDSKGNMYCFKLSDCENKQTDCAVWFFDRAISSVTKVSDTFVEWLDGLNEPTTNNSI